MRIARWLGLALVIAPLALNACRPSPTPATTPTLSAPDLAYTAAAQTAEARMTANALQPTATQEPTRQPSPTASLTPLPASPTMTTTLTLPGLATTAPPGSGAASADRARFIADMTVPDGSVFSPGTKFTKTWRLENAGTTTWTPAYSLVFISGAKMGAPDSVALKQEVSPGTSIDISIDMAAPSTAGSHRGYWKMINAAGRFFEEPIYVDIVVSGEGTPVAATVTPGGTAGLVTQVTISADNTNVSGDCPHTFTFTTGFTLSGAATLTYKFEAGSNTPGFNFNLPGAQTASYQAGSYTVVYTLNIEDSVEGWARLHITSPVDIASDELAFSLTCQ